MGKIYDNVKALLQELGDNVSLLLAVKGRSVEEVRCDGWFKREVV